MDLFGRKAQAALRVALLREREQARAARDAQNEAIELRVQVARLEERLKPFEASPSPIKLYKTEDEEEADYLYDTGKIDYDEYQRVLKAAGFNNTSIELAPEVSDIKY